MWELILSIILLVAAWVLYARQRRSARSLERKLRQLQAENRWLTEQLTTRLAQESKKQDAVFNSMVEGVMILDSSDRILWVNRAFQRLFRIEMDLKGRSIMEALRMPQMKELLDRVHQERRVRDFDLQPPDLNERFLQINAAEFAGSEGDSEGMIIVFHDLTRTKQLERTRTDFVANVSHELRTPLSLIKGYTETLIDGAHRQEETALKFLKTILKHVDRLTFLIEDLLIISRLESGQISMNRCPTRLNALAEKVLEDLHSRLEEHPVSIRNEIHPDLHVVADADRLQQVFFNLIDNAIKYAGDGAVITLNTRPENDDWIIACVADNGPGIPPEALERIFERFYRVDQARSREQGGTGLGLAIVKHIIKSHGGQVWAESGEPKGTRFYFTLPTSVADD